MTSPTEKNLTLRPLVVADRLAGMRNKDIATKHGISRVAVGCHLRRAVLYGEVTEGQLGLRPRKIPIVTDEQWFARILAKTVTNDRGCLVWTGFVTGKGYGQTTYRGRNIMIHRQVYKMAHGVELATEEFVCHSCDERRCWNKDHLFLGDAHANNTDCGQKGRHHNSVKTRCPKGHEYTPENTYVTPRGLRDCRACGLLRAKDPVYAAKRREWQRARKARQRAQRLQVA